jgi:tetratricopeptide (TPR) repeat protein
MGRRQGAAKSLFVLLALGLWNLACPTSLAEDDDPNGLNQLIEQGRYQEAIPIAERAVEVAKRVRGPEHPETADALQNLGLVFERIGDDAKAESLFQEALRIRQKALGPEHPDTATGLTNLALLEFDLNQIDEATALARQASAAELTILSKIFSFTSEQQRLAYLNIFHPYNLFALLKGTETDLAQAALRYKGVVLDSIVEDRLLAEASQGSNVRGSDLNRLFCSNVANTRHAPFRGPFRRSLDA